MTNKRKTGARPWKMRHFMLIALPSMPLIVLAGVQFAGLAFGFTVPMGLIAAFVTVLSAAVLIVVFRVRGADQRFLRKHAFRVCRSCWHSLEGHASDPTGSCPECGHAFDHVKDEKAWRADFRIPD